MSGEYISIETAEKLKKLDELEDKIIGLETERDVLKSQVSDLKADKKYYIEQKEKYQNVVEKTKNWLKEESERLHNICGDNWTTVGQAVYQDVLNKMEGFENES